MKKIIVVMVAIALCVSANAQCGKMIYNKYSEVDGVDATFISKAMFRMMKALPSVVLSDDDEVDVKSMIKDLDGMYIIESNDAGLWKKIHADALKYLDANGYELMLENKEDGENVKIYTLGKDDTVSEMVIMNTDVYEMDFISMTGNISKEEINSKHRK